MRSAVAAYPGLRSTVRTYAEDRVAEVSERTPDDMAACILHAHGDGVGTLRVEELDAYASESPEAAPRSAGSPMSASVGSRPRG